MLQCVETVGGKDAVVLVKMIVKSEQNFNAMSVSSQVIFLILRKEMVANSESGHSTLYWGRIPFQYIQLARYLFPHNCAITFVEDKIYLAFLRTDKKRLFTLHTLFLSLQLKVISRKFVLTEKLFKNQLSISMSVSSIRRSTSCVSH